MAIPAPTSNLKTGSRPRLGVDFHVWDQLFQGSRSHLIGLYRAAIVQAPDLDFVFFLADPASLRSTYPEFRLPHVRLIPMPHRPGPVRLGLQLPWLQYRHRIDLLHMQYRLPLLRSAACACTIHDVLFETHPQYFPRLFRWQSHWSYLHAARRAALLMTVSDYSRGEIARHYGVPSDRIVMTPNAVDPARFHPGTEGSDIVHALGLVPGRYLLTVGRLEPRKNHLALIEAYARLSADTPTLVILGQRDFQYTAALDAIDRLKLNARVRVLESVGDADLPAVMRHALLFAYPSHAEGFGMPVLEAMASGVPVVTSRCTALSEVAGDAAWLVEPDSIVGLADALSQLLAQPTRRAAMIAAGLRQVGLFDWARSATALLDGVRHVLANQMNGGYASIRQT